MKYLFFFWAILIVAPLSGQRTGKDYAIFFYVTDFQPGWAALPETAKEAADLKSELETNFGFICELVPNPSKQLIRTTIRAYNAKLTANDQVLYFFSMHGHYDETSDRGFLIGTDGFAQDLYFDSWLSFDDLRTDLARCKAKHVLLALDACHSGAFGIRNKSRPEIPGYSQTETCAQRIAKTFQFSGRQYCSSGNKNAKTPSKSLFAIRFLEALRKGGQDGILTFDDLEYYLGKIEMPRPEIGAFNGHETSGDFVFVKKISCTSKSDAIEATETDIWEKTKQWNNIENYQKFLKDYPNSAFKEAAEAKIIALRDKNDPQADNLIFIKGGRFQMGSNDSENNSEAPIHEVTVSDFYLSRFEVTNAQFCTFLNSYGQRPKNSEEWVDFADNRYLLPNTEARLVKKNIDIYKSEYSVMPGYENHPVISVTWDGAKAYCDWLTGLTGKQHRLPTEAEWEFAAGGGTGARTKFAGTDNIEELNKYVNYCDLNCRISWSDKTQSDGFINTAQVGKFLPNKLGLYDMIGNVYEWCSDSWHSNYTGAPNDGSSWLSGNPSDERVLRGGSWYNSKSNCRITYRYRHAVDAKWPHTGFRVARSK